MYKLVCMGCKEKVRLQSLKLANWYNKWFHFNNGKIIKIQRKTK